MTKPGKPALDEGGVHSSEASTSQQFFVRNLMLSTKSENTTEVSLVLFFVTCTRLVINKKSLILAVFLYDT